MADYKRNHTVPVFLLKYWVDEATQYKGVHVFDLVRDKIIVSTSQGKRPFSFAINEDIYVHDGYTTRSVGLEKWFSGQEAELSNLANKVHNRMPILIKTTFQMTKIMMALTSLEYRSNYSISLITKKIESEKDLRCKISANPERAIKQIVLENLVHLITEQSMEYMPAVMLFMHSPPNCDWVISDRPYFNDESLEFRLIVLTNKVLVAYSRSADFSYRHIDVSIEDFEFFNKYLALNAREWLVVKDKTELGKYRKLYKTTEWANLKSHDTVVYKDINRLTSGWTIDR